MFAFSHRLSLLTLLVALSLSGLACNGEEPVVTEEEFQLTTHEAFFETLRSLCDQEFYGETTYPEDPDHEMVGAELYMHVAVCEENEIRIPFHVDDNTSRTWVLTLQDGDLLLKHDHRHEDGTPEDLTNYGGFADHRGDAFRQFFPADDETAEMLPEASTNVWMMEVDLEEMTFVYYLERHDEPRYRAEFVLADDMIY
ncbi:hypothetical protein QA596_11415 [Balneolales bacterium ANBcel1]|nr:hypothetical protein [Balneolales bacterium ANBcel1]